MTLPTNDIIPNLQKEATLQSYGVNAFAILINENDTTLTINSPVADIIAKELPDASGYARELISVDTISVSGAGDVVTAAYTSASWSFTADVTFTHVVLLNGAISTIADTTGQAWWIHPVNGGNPLTRGSGDSPYEHTLTNLNYDLL